MKRWSAVLLVASVLLLVAGALLHARRGYFHEDLSGHARGTDDAYISYRYARHLWTGQGLVFNPGERVEGYSNLLYVLLIAPAFAFTEGDGVYRWSLALNVALALAALLVHHLHLRARAGAAWASVASLLFAASPVVWLWVAAGMETPLVLLLQVALWALVEREADGGVDSIPRVWLPSISVLLVLARADGFLAPVLAVAFLAWRRSWGAAARTAAAVAASLGALVAWRLAYYGAALPNTYFAKVSGPAAERWTAALVQLRDLSLGHAGLAPWLIALAVGLVLGARRGRVPFASVLGLGWVVYWVWVGGDVFGERFLIVLVPLGAAVLVETLGIQPAAITGAPSPGAPMWPRAVVAGAVAFTFAFQLWPLAADRRFRYGERKYDRWVELGRLLAPEAARGRTLAICAAGKVPFYSGLPAVDMLGLTDAHIGRAPARQFRVGHSKHDPDYVLARRPDLLATWIDEGLDLRWGLGRARWEGAGYRLRYLAFTRRRPPGRAIVDVSSLEEGRIVALIRAGYQYAVLERE